MQKVTVVLLILLSLGTALMVSSWWASYPLMMSSQFDFVFNHVSIMYWVSLPILYVALFACVVRLRNKTAKVLCLFAIILVMQSLVYFYYRIPGSDSQDTRGLTEYLLNTGNLTRTRAYYFQWPSLFILETSFTLVPGLSLSIVEFALFTAILFFYVGILYLFASRYDCTNAHLLVIGFFIVAPYIFEFQLVPFFVSTSLLFLLFLIQSRTASRETTVLTLILFASVSLTHALVPLFAILYTIVRAREKNHREYFIRLTLIEVIIYLIVTMAVAPIFFAQSIQIVGNILSSTYSNVLERTFTAARAAPRTLVDIYAQMVSRVVAIGTVSVLCIGFIALLMKKRLKHVDISLLFAGGAYAIAGFVLPILGERSWIVLVAVLSLGSLYSFGSRHTRWFEIALLCFLVLSISFRVDSSFFDTQTFFQTRAEYQSANFFLESVRLTSYPNAPVTVLSHFRTVTYLLAKGGGDVSYTTDFSSGFPTDISANDYVLFTVGLGKSFLRLNVSDEEYDRIWSAFDIVENTGSTFLALNMNSSKVR